jgi:hypothetical protein
LGGFSKTPNNGWKRIVSVAAAKMILDGGTKLLDEAAGPTFSITHLTLLRTFHITVREVAGPHYVEDSTDHKDAYQFPTTPTLVYPGTVSGSYGCNISDDGCTPGETLTFKIYQISSRVGRGRFKKETI